jgi:hypothetical protein
MPAGYAKSELTGRLLLQPDVDKAGPLSPPPNVQSQVEFAFCQFRFTILNNVGKDVNSNW